MLLRTVIKRSGRMERLYMSDPKWEWYAWKALVGHNQKARLRRYSLDQATAHLPTFGKPEKNINTASPPFTRAEFGFLKYRNTRSVTRQLYSEAPECLELPYLWNLIV